MSISLRFFAASLFLSLLAGCASVSPVKPGTSAIEIATPYTANSRGGTVYFPAGVYQPDFRSADGVYYRAPSAVVARGFGLQATSGGGLYIPFAETTSPAHWMWMGTELTPSFRYPFDPPLRFRYVRVDAPVSRLPDAPPPTP
jgi:hypothetical protein